MRKSQKDGEWVLIFLLLKVVKMAAYNWVDFIILAILLLSIFGGLARGFLREVLAILLWVVSFLVASMFSSSVAGIFSGGDTISPLTLCLSFLMLFVITFILGLFLNLLILGTFESSGAGFFNRLLGGLFGVLRGFLINLILIFLIGLTSFSQSSGWQQSKLIPAFQPYVMQVGDYVYPQYQNLVNKVRSAWNEGESYLINSI